METHNQALLALRRVIAHLAQPESLEAPAAIARGCPLTELLWRPLAGDCFTSVLTFGSASERRLPPTLEALQLTASARQLTTQPQPRRLHPAPTLAAAAQLLERLEQTTADVTADVEALEKVARAGALVVPAPSEYGQAIGYGHGHSGYDGYDDIIAELDETRKRVGDPSTELAVLKRLVRRLLADVRVYAAAGV